MITQKPGQDQGERPAGLSRDIDKGQYMKLRIASLNVGTMRGRAAEIVEMLSRQNIDICCVQETRWKGESARKIMGKDSHYKFFWKGDESGHGGVGVLIKEKWIESVLSIARVSSRIILMKMLIEKTLFNITCVYAPQVGLSNQEKDTFYEQLLTSIHSVDDSELHFIAGDFNGHVGKESVNFDGYHGGKGYGTRNPEGLRILDLCSATDMAVTNTFFDKNQNKLITYSSGENKSQIDYILVKRSFLKYVRDVKIIRNEECVTQHKLLVADITIIGRSPKPRTVPPRRKVWKLRDPNVRKEYETFVNARCAEPPTNQEPMCVNVAWNNVKSCLLKGVDQVCGWTRGGKARHTETWWWNNEVDQRIKDKRRLWKLWKQGGSKVDYLAVKKIAKKAVYNAKKEAQEARFTEINSERDCNKIFKLAKKMKSENSDVIGDKCVKDKDGNLALSEKDKLRTWKAHYEQLLNVEFDWDETSLSVEPSVEGPAIKITHDLVASAVSNMKEGKACGPSGIVIEMVKAGGVAMLDLLTDMINLIIKEERIPDDWNHSTIINCFKGKGNATICGNYRGLKLLEHAMKVLERIIETIIRKQVDIDSMQFGFMPGRSTTDAIFILRQMQEKHHSKRKTMYAAFVDLEKAFDRVPCKVLWWSLRKLGVEEWVIRLVQAMYSNAQSRVQVNGNSSESFNVTVGVHQGSVLSPLLFIIVMEALSREFRVSCPWELLYANDLAILSGSLEELKNRLAAWKTSLESYGLRVNVDKTKILVSSVEHRKVPLNNPKYPCGVCSFGVGVNSILCTLCNLWVHKKCSGLNNLHHNSNFVCRKCSGVIVPTNNANEKIKIGSDSFEVVPSFRYLGDTLGNCGGCSDAVSTRVIAAWRAFRELLPILTNRAIRTKLRGNVHNACVRKVLLYGSETWPVLNEDIQRLVTADNGMTRWICGVSLKDQIPSADLLSRLGLDSIKDVLRWNRLRYHGHLLRMDDDVWPKMATMFHVEGSQPKGRPRKRLTDVLKADMRALNLSNEDANNRGKWRKAVKPVPKIQHVGVLPAHVDPGR